LNVARPSRGWFGAGKRRSRYRKFRRSSPDRPEPSLLPLLDLDAAEHDILAGALEDMQAVAALQEVHGNKDPADFGREVERSA
jgi:hypothetical protein